MCQLTRGDGRRDGGTLLEPQFDLVAQDSRTWRIVLAAKCRMGQSGCKADA